MALLDTLRLLLDRDDLQSDALLGDEVLLLLGPDLMEAAEDYQNRRRQALTGSRVVPVERSQRELALQLRDRLVAARMPGQRLKALEALHNELGGEWPVVSWLWLAIWQVERWETRQHAIAAGGFVEKLLWQGNRGDEAKARLRVADDVAWGWVRDILWIAAGARWIHELRAAGEFDLAEGVAKLPAAVAADDESRALVRDLADAMSLFGGAERRAAMGALGTAWWRRAQRMGERRARALNRRWEVDGWWRPGPQGLERHHSGEPLDLRNLGVWLDDLARRFEVGGEGGSLLALQDRGFRGLPARWPEGGNPGPR